ncbi:hypothetical protein E4N62_24330 [Streptomyces sp. MNU76]|uniref:hypothetical protein n=1 Tax=Streptomyces sp. MNU76 TaxID=2560026 RepID=UPI001E427025|nr:hypothetical protein [Streptomyces sp. MNU76]MCC9708111.1 hypothetical protein [Streptomyces sp. MNU76]
MARARALAGPLLRLLGLAVVLFAVALTHGATPESAGGHGVTSAVTSATVATELPPHGGDVPSTISPAAAVEALVGPSADLHDRPGGHGDHGVDGPAEHCASAQPQQGPSLGQPRFAVSVSEVVAPGCAPSARDAGEAHPSDRSSAALRALVVQQV